MRDLLKIAEECEEIIESFCCGYEHFPTYEGKPCDCDSCLALKQSAAALREAHEKIQQLRTELNEAEITRVGILAEMNALKSTGPFSVDGQMVLCEDTGIFLTLSHDGAAQAVANKLNKMSAELARPRAKLDCHETAPSLLRDNFAFAKEVDKLRAELDIVHEFLNSDREDMGVAQFQNEMKAALKEA